MKNYWILFLLIPLMGCSRHQGRLLTCTIEALSLTNNCLRISDRQHLAVYLPPSYGDANRHFPVLYLLPNLNTCLWRYTGGSYQGFHLAEAMDRQIRSHKAQEMIIVVPNTVHVLGGSWYQNSPLTGNCEDYLVKDVVHYVDGHFRTIPSAKARALAGHGVGGTGAVELGLKHPELFGCIYALSPALFDTNGLTDLGILGQKQLKRWNALSATWSSLDERSRRKAFRDYIQGRLNSPSRGMFFEGLYLSYAAAFAPDLNLPFPHIGLPGFGADAAWNKDLQRQYENGLGGWDEKLAAYSAKASPLRSIVIEYTKDDDYAWIRRGAAYVSNLMQSRGIPNTLVVHEGTHESTLGKRLETAMLPTVSNALAHD